MVLLIWQCTHNKRNMITEEKSKKEEKLESDTLFLCVSFTLKVSEKVSRMKRTDVARKNACPPSDKVGQVTHIRPVNSTITAHVGPKMAICGSPEGGSAPPFDGDGTMPGDNSKRPTEIRRTGKDGPVLAHKNNMQVACIVLIYLFTSYTPGCG